MAQQPYTLDTMPAKGVFSITPADGAGLDTTWGKPIRGIYVGVTGNISFIGLDGVTADLPNATAGAVYQIPMLRVNSTSTTATSLRGLV
jgi:hypothetical protein